MYIASFDAGTTALKGVLVEESGRPALSRSVELSTFYDGERKEQDPRDWWTAFCTVSRELTAAVDPADISAVIMSGQMQDVICLDAANEPVGNAILYSDGRAVEQARRLESAVGAERFLAVTGNRCDGSLPLPKLMWMQEERPELYARTAHVLISSKDYLIARLTGRLCGDVTACSTAGAMDIREKRWSAEVLAAAGVAPALLPALLPPHEQAGVVLAGTGCGYRPGTPVYAGIGDAGATTLASGIARPGQVNINLGTSGWVAAVSQSALTTEPGVFNLAAAEPGSYINVVPFLNAGGVHRWISGLLGGYEAVSALLADSTPGSHGTLFLPYLAGERFPVLDADIRGGFAGLTAETTAADLARAALEGVAFSLRQGLERLPGTAAEISVIGGGSREPVWCQILADVLGREIAVFQNGEFLPAISLAGIVLVARGRLASYAALPGFLRAGSEQTVYRPAPERTALYDGAYARFCRLYPALRGVG